MCCLQVTSPVQDPISVTRQLTRAFQDLVFHWILCVMVILTAQWEMMKYNVVGTMLLNSSNDVLIKA